MYRKSDPRSYWFQATVRRNGIITPRQGTLHADFAYQAVEKLKKMAAEEWKVPLVSVSIYELTRDAKVGREIIKINEQALTRVKSSGVYVPPKTQYTPKTDEPKPYTFGTYHQQRGFATLILEDTK